MQDKILNIAHDKKIDIIATCICLFKIAPKRSELECLKQLDEKQCEFLLRVCEVIDPRRDCNSGNLDEYYHKLNIHDDYQTWCCKRRVDDTTVQPRTFYLQKKSKSNTHVIVLTTFASEHSVERHKPLLQENFKHLNSVVKLTPPEEEIETSKLAIEKNQSNNNNAPEKINEKHFKDLTGRPSKRLSQLLSLAINIYQQDAHEFWPQCCKLFADTLPRVNADVKLDRMARVLSLGLRTSAKSDYIMHASELSHRHSEFIDVFFQHLSKEDTADVQQFICLSLRAAPDVVKQYSATFKPVNSHIANEWVGLSLQCLANTITTVKQQINRMLALTKGGGRQDYQHTNVIFNRCCEHQMFKNENINSSLWVWLAQSFDMLDNWNRKLLYETLSNKDISLDQILWLCGISNTSNSYQAFRTTMRWLDQQENKLNEQQQESLCKQIIKIMNAPKDNYMSFTFGLLVSQHKSLLKKIGVPAAEINKSCQSYQQEYQKVIKPIAQKNNNKSHKKKNKAVKKVISFAPYNQNMSLQDALNIFYKQCNSAVNSIDVSKHSRTVLKENNNDANNNQTKHAISLLTFDNCGKNSSAVLYKQKSSCALKVVKPFYNYLLTYLNKHGYTLSNSDNELLTTSLFKSLITIPGYEHTDTPFYFVCIADHSRCLNLLLKLLPADTLCEQSSYPLIDCIQLNLPHIIELLLANGMNSNKGASIYGRLPIDSATQIHKADQYTDKTQIIDLLIRHGADLEYRFPIEQSIPNALLYGNVTIFLLNVIRSCEDLNNQRQARNVDLLLQRGADPAASYWDHRGVRINALDIAITYKNNKLAKRLHLLGVKPCAGFLPYDFEMFALNNNAVGDHTEQLH